MILLFLINNSFWESILYGIGVGVLYTGLNLLQSWVNKKVKSDLIHRYENQECFKELGFKIEDERIVKGTLNGYPIELIVEVKGESKVKFLLKIDLSNKPILNNHTNLKRVLKTQKFKQDGDFVFIPNWNTGLNTAKKFNLLVVKINQILNEIENQTL
ncbi:MAG: hypothetical protein H6607_00695 [Flavobacteriales bacterium]|nr:hypothetical protein [Flavobacteriales bacterium]